MARTNDITERDIQVLKLIQSLPSDENGLIVAKLKDIRPDNMSMSEFREILQFIAGREITAEEKTEVIRRLNEE